MNWWLFPPYTSPGEVATVSHRPGQTCCACRNKTETRRSWFPAEHWQVGLSLPKPDKKHFSYPHLWFQHHQRLADLLSLWGRSAEDLNSLLLLLPNVETPQQSYECGWWLSWGQSHPQPSATLPYSHCTAQGAGFTSRSACWHPPHRIRRRRVELGAAFIPQQNGACLMKAIPALIEKEKGEKKPKTMVSTEY